jgi:hypothetical protein
VRSEFPLPSHNRRYAISWPYLERSHVIVLVDDIPWPYRWVSDAEVELDAGPDGELPGSKLVIQRVTPDLESYVDIRDAAALTAPQLSVLRRQLLYLLQERSGGLAGSVAAAVNAASSQFGTIADGLDNINQIVGQLTEGLATLDDLNAEVVIARNDAAAARAGLLTEITQRVAEYAALRDRTLGLENEAVELGARIATETTQRITEDGALATSITELTAASQAADATLSAAVTATNVALTDGDAALAASIESVRADFESADAALHARVDSEVTALTDADSALAARVTSLEVTGGPGGTPDLTAVYAAIDEVDQARIEGDTALASRATSLEAKVNLSSGQTVQGLINQVNQSRADGDSALASSLTTLQATVGSQGTTLAQVSDNLTATANALDVVEASRVIKTVARSDGKEAVAGIGLAATSNGTVAQSEIILMADRLLMVPPGDANGTPTPIMVMGTVNGVPTTVYLSAKFGDQSIGARVLVDGSIETRHLKVTGSQGMSVWHDPYVEDPTTWAFGGHGVMATRVTLSDGIAGTNAWRSPSGSGAASVEGTNRVSLIAGQRYRVSCYARKSAAATGGFYLRMIASDSPNGTVLAQVVGGDATYLSQYLGVVEGNTLTTAWQRYSWEFVPTQSFRYAGPRVILNWTGSAGYQEVQNIRIEQMLDASLVVEGGITADRLDTRLLTIKDAAGNIIFGSGVGLDYSRIVGLTRPADNATSDVVLIARGGLTINGNTVFQSGTSSGWGEHDCYSANAMVGGAYAAATLGAVSGGVMIGLNSDPLSDRSYGSLDYALHPSDDGMLYAFESGNGYTLQAWAVGDELMVSYDGSAVRFLRNGVVLRTTQTTANRTFYLDSAFAKQGTILRNVRFGPYGNPSALQPSNPLTSSNITTYIANAAIGSAQIGVLSAANLTVGALSDTVSGGTTSGGRTVIIQNGIRVYDATNALRVKIGYLL